MKTNPKFSITKVMLAAALGLAVLVGCSSNKTATSTRTDGEVARDVQAKIAADSNIPSKTYTVGVSNGVATLTGTVSSDFERTAAQNDASQVAGVSSVVNNLTVASASSTAAKVGGSQSPEAANTQIASTESKPSSLKTTSSNSKPKASAAHKDHRVAAAPRVPTSNQTTADATSDSNTPAANANDGATVPETNNTNEQVQPPSTPLVPATVSVPAGTTLSVRTVEALDTGKTQPDTVFHGTLTSDVYAGDQIAIPAGANVEGRVTQVQDAGHFKGQSLLALQLTKVSYSGHSYSITSDEWSRKGNARGKNTAEKVGGGAALGALIGAIAGGGKGAAIGAGIGAGAGGTAQAVTRGQQVRLNPETVLSFRLQNPVTVTPSTSNVSGRQKIQPNDNSY